MAAQRMASKELGQALRDRGWVLHLQEVPGPLSCSSRFAGTTIGASRDPRKREARWRCQVRRAPVERSQPPVRGPNCHSLSDGRIPPKKLSVDRQRNAAVRACRVAPDTAPRATRRPRSGNSSSLPSSLRLCTLHSRFNGLKEGWRAGHGHQRGLEKGERVHPPRIVVSELQRHGAPGAVPGNVRPLDTEVLQKLFSVRCVLGEADR